MLPSSRVGAARLFRPAPRGACGPGRGLPAGAGPWAGPWTARRLLPRPSVARAFPALGVANPVSAPPRLGRVAGECATWPGRPERAGCLEALRGPGAEARPQAGEAPSGGRRTPGGRAGGRAGGGVRRARARRLPGVRTGRAAPADREPHLSIALIVPGRRSPPLRLQARPPPGCQGAGGRPRPDGVGAAAAAVTSSR